MSDMVVTGIIGVIGGVLGAFIAGWLVRIKTKADAAGAITDAALKLIAPLGERIDVLEKKTAMQDTTIDRFNRRFDRYAKRVNYLTNGIESLVKQIKEMGCQPSWTPDQWDPDAEEY